MTKVAIIIGLNVDKIHFQQGGSSVDGLLIEDDFTTKWICHHNSTYRTLPENSLHPSKYNEKLVTDIRYCKNHWDMYITTHSMNTINIISEMVRSGEISNDDVEIIIVNEGNTGIDQVCKLDKEGYLMPNWPIGFFSV